MYHQVNDDDRWRKDPRAKASLITICRRTLFFVRGWFYFYFFPTPEVVESSPRNRLFSERPHKQNIIRCISVYEYSSENPISNTWLLGGKNGCVYNTSPARCVFSHFRDVSAAMGYKNAYFYDTFLKRKPRTRRIYLRSGPRERRQRRRRRERGNEIFLTLKIVSMYIYISIIFVVRNPHWYVHIVTP